MITATKKFRFEMAHMLSNHPSLCKNVHGHSYILEVTACTTTKNTGDMVVDFSDLKNIVNNTVVNDMDHAFAYNVDTTDECELAIVDVLKKYGKKIVAFTGRPTAEVMCKEIYNKLSTDIQYITNNYRLCKVRLYETESGWVEYAE